MLPSYQWQPRPTRDAREGIAIAVRELTQSTPENVQNNPSENTPISPLIIPGFSKTPLRWQWRIVLGKMTEGNIDNRRDEDGIIFNDGSAGSIGTVNNYYGSTNPYKAGIPFQVPPVPSYFVPRPQYADRVRNHLLCEDADQPGTLVVSAIHGLGGIGKSVLAAAIAHEPEIRDRFPDGILWITLGQQPDLLVALGDWIRSLGDRDYKPTTVQAASSYLRSLLVDKTMLLVVDDLWDSAHFEPFRLAGKGCRVLVTTRQVRLTHAKPCELGLLTVGESVALVEGCLGEELAEGERGTFEEFARAVGFLPLALELAAVQVEDGYDWASLLADFREEFDILDVDEGAGSDEERRDRSLRACFNLSLKRLDGEQLRRFAWLGVLPEDVSVDARMVATVWGVKLVRARKGLLELRRRSLLLSGVSVSVARQQEPTFRQHDLLHELAQKQLAEGLGLSVEAAHGELLARYRPESGRWWELADDGYIHRQLTWHMERAGQIAEMHELIRAADDNGSNAWGEACEELGLLTVFVEDVARAWRCAEERYGIIPTEAEGWRWQFWCAFAIGSLNSLVENIPGKLLATAVRQGHWSEARALAYALQKREEGDQAAALVTLMPELQEQEVVKEVIQVARMITSPQHRAQLLIALTQSKLCYGTQQPDALQAIREIADESAKASAIKMLLTNLHSEFLIEALNITRQISNENIKTITLSAIAVKYPSVFNEALQAARKLYHIYDKFEALSILAEQRLEIFKEIRKEILNIGSYTQARTAAELIKRMRDVAKKQKKAPTWLKTEESLLIQKTLSVAREIPHEPERTGALAELASIHPDIFGEALCCIREQYRDDGPDILTVLIGDAPKELASMVLDLFDEAVRNDDARAQALGKLAENLDPASFSKALRVITHYISDPHSQAIALASISKRMPRELVDKAVAIARHLKSLDARSIGLVALAEVDERLFEEALRSVRQISDNNGTLDSVRLDDMNQVVKLNQVMRMIFLVGEQPELYSEALAKIYEISDKYKQVCALLALSKEKHELFGQALKTACQISDKDSRASALNDLLSELPKEFFKNVQGGYLDHRNRIASSLSVGVLERLAKKLMPQFFRRSVFIIHNPLYNDKPLVSLAQKRDVQLSTDELADVIAIRDPYHRAKALAGVTDRTSWEAIVEDHNENLLRLLSTRERKHLIELLPKLHPTLLELGGQPAVDAALDAMRDACNQWP